MKSRHHGWRREDQGDLSYPRALFSHMRGRCAGYGVQEPETRLELHVLQHDWRKPCFPHRSSPQVQGAQPQASGDTMCSTGSQKHNVGVRSEPQSAEGVRGSRPQFSRILPCFALKSFSPIMSSPNIYDLLKRSGQRTKVLLSTNSGYSKECSVWPQPVLLCQKKLTWKSQACSLQKGLGQGWPLIGIWELGFWKCAYHSLTDNDGRLVC